VTSSEFTEGTLWQDKAMTDRHTNWKKRLLRTSVPLEHEVARILSQRGFGISADYSYFRVHAGLEKEFSVDVRGVKGVGGLAMAGRQCVLDVLVECKYRDRGATWLFLQNPTNASCQLHEALQYVDLLSPKFVHDISWHDGTAVKDCYAAVEVGSSDQAGEDDKSSGRAIESQLRHGVRQLQYALPALLALRARSVAFCSPDENLPFFFAPILVTNASLIVTDPKFSVAVVEDAETLDDLGTRVPYLIWSSELGPDFDVHCQRQLAELAKLAATKQMKAVEERRKLAGAASWTLPSVLAARIAAAGGATNEFSEFDKVIVSNIGFLGEVIDTLGGAFERMAASLKEEPIMRWD
jgi:hypothetical protein